jgi:type II secretory pathway pseudopilin PulG
MNKHTHTSKNKKQGGYMLIEIMVSLAIFSIVTITSAAALLAIIDANSKAQNLKAVMDNLSVSIENMSRSLRIGTDYKCITASGDAGSYDDAMCGNGTNGISFRPQDANLADPTDRVEYYFAPDSSNLDQNGNPIGTIFRKRGNGSAVAITAPEVTIKNVKFFVMGSGPTPGQPRVFININGEAGITAFSLTPFNIQTSVSQREIENVFASNPGGGNNGGGDDGGGDDGGGDDPGNDAILIVGQTYHLGVGGYSHNYTITYYNIPTGAFTADGESGGLHEIVTGTITPTSMTFSSTYTDAGYDYDFHTTSSSFANGQYDGTAEDNWGAQFAWSFIPTPI